MHAVPEAIKVAVDQLSNIPGAVVESSLEFVETECSWAVRLRLITACSSKFVPRETRWVALVESSYPAGQIRIYPDEKGGLVHTFPHQDRNVPSSSKNATWRTGKPCLDSTTQRLGRIAGGPEPQSDTELRLRWHVERCLGWLNVAGGEQLMTRDEPFEAPQYPVDLPNTRFRVVHDEGNDTWPNWSEFVGQCGEVHWSVMRGFKKTIFAERFLSDCSQEIRVCRREFQSSEWPMVGYWWLWPAPIVLPPWHAPGTWAELRQIGNTLGVNVDHFIFWLARHASGKENVIILLGYPIPTLWHGKPMEVHWQGILSPDIPRTIEPMKGFRPNQLGQYERLKRDIFGRSKRLVYLNTSNWHPDRLQARGRFTSELRTSSIAVIGVGSLGSAVVELLARGGVTKILIVDNDNLESGNLVRHTLTGAELGRNKAEATAERLQTAAPMSSISTHTDLLPSGDLLQNLLEPYDIVIDCSGEDEVLKNLAATWWPIPRQFLSASLGFGARRLFLFGVKACAFPFDDFAAAVKPWLDAERLQWSMAGETLEGAGCWSPLFPARYDDVWLSAVATVKHLDSSALGKWNNKLRVLEQSSDENVAGFQVILDSVIGVDDVSVSNNGGAS